jgi:hypothetical protein
LAWAIITACYFPVVRFYDMRPQWSLTLLLVVLFYMGATIWWALQFWSNQGGEWKGRVQEYGLRFIVGNARAECGADTASPLAPQRNHFPTRFPKEPVQCS